MKRSVLYTRKTRSCNTLIWRKTTKDPTFSVMDNQTQIPGLKDIPDLSTRSGVTGVSEDWHFNKKNIHQVLRKMNKLKTNTCSENQTKNADVSSRRWSVPGLLTQRSHCTIQCGECEYTGSQSSLHCMGEAYTVLHTIPHTKITTSIWKRPWWNVV